MSRGCLSPPANPLTSVQLAFPFPFLIPLPHLTLLLLEIAARRRKKSRHAGLGGGKKFVLFSALQTTPTAMQLLQIEYEQTRLPYVTFPNVVALAHFYFFLCWWVRPGVTCPIHKKTLFYGLRLFIETTETGHRTFRPSVEDCSSAAHP